MKHFPFSCQPLLFLSRAARLFLAENLHSTVPSWKLFYTRWKSLLWTGDTGLKLEPLSSPTGRMALNTAQRCPCPSVHAVPIAVRAQTHLPVSSKLQALVSTLASPAPCSQLETPVFSVPSNHRQRPSSATSTPRC